MIPFVEMRLVKIWLQKVDITHSYMFDTTLIHNDKKEIIFLIDTYSTDKRTVTYFVFISALG